MTEQQGGSETMPPAIPDKAALLERIRDAQRALDALLTGVPAERLTTPGADGWSIKDEIAHLAAWRRSVVALFAGQPRHTAVGVDRATWESDDVDALNQRIHEANQNRPLAEVVADFRAANDAIIAAIERLPADDLLKPASAFVPGAGGADPIIGTIADNTWDHDPEHVARIRALLS